LKIDPRYFRFHSYVRGLEAESADVTSTAAMWRELARRQSNDKTQPAVTEAVALLHNVRALEPLARGDSEMQKRVGHLEAEVWRAARPVSGDLPLAKEARAAQGLAAQAQAMRGKLIDAATALADQSLGELHARLANLRRQARLAQIDAVIGKKKKLEIEISNLSKGRFPPDMFGKLHVEGLIGDDEEYWPPEGEYWSDEYENFK
jgi:hypothetical protein